MIPQNNRIGRRLAAGRFEATEWIGSDFLMGVAIARDVERGVFVRLTFAGDVSRSADELSLILTREVPGLASVVYLGPTAADDGWGTGSMMMAEVLPAGKALDLEVRADAQTVAAFGGDLTAHVARVHHSGTVLGTLQPENIYVAADGGITVVGRGERLWLMPRPNMMKVAVVPPWRLGYRAPEIMMAPVLDHPEPSADVFSLGAMLATWLLGEFPYQGGSDFEVFQAQLKNEHLPLPETPLGALLTRCLRSDAAARPAVLELERALGAIASEGN